MKNGVLIIALTLSVTFGNTPDQFIAKMYSEALGRIPDQEGWNYWLSYLGDNPSIQQIQDFANATFTGQEFLSQNYSSTQQVQAVYRALLNRDVGSEGARDYWAGMIDQFGMPWVVSFFVNGVEFSEITYPQIVGGEREFIVDAYLNALDRFPDQEAWDYWANFVGQNSDIDNLSIFIHAVFEGVEFQNRGLNATEQVTELYRTILLREPDGPGLAYHSNNLNTQGIEYVVNEMLISPEFLEIVHPSLEGEGSYAWTSNSSINVANPWGGAWTGCDYFQPGVTMTQAQLQALLNAADNDPVSKIVCLDRGQVVELTNTLILPEGVTLTTVGFPNPTSYLSMGRLIRRFQSGNLLELSNDNSTLSNLWIDGQRSRIGISNRDQLVVVFGDNTEISDCKFTSTNGRSNINLPPTVSNTLITRNLITAYESEHDNPENNFTDGITDHSINSTVTFNRIIDATDVAIVCFKRREDQTINVIGPIKNSTYTNNQILNAGNDAFGALGVDNGWTLIWDGGAWVPATPPHTPLNFDYSGTVISNNTIWTGNNAHYEVLMPIGTRLWFGADSDFGENITVENNTSRLSFVNAYMGVFVNDFSNSIIQGNDFDVRVIETNDPTLPTGAFLVLDNVSNSTTNADGLECDANGENCVSASPEVLQLSNGLPRAGDYH